MRLNFALSAVHGTYPADIAIMRPRKQWLGVVRAVEAPFAVRATDNCTVRGASPPR